MDDSLSAMLAAKAGRHSWAEESIDVMEEYDVKKILGRAPKKVQIKSNTFELTPQWGSIVKVQDEGKIVNRAESNYLNTKFKARRPKMEFNKPNMKAGTLKTSENCHKTYNPHINSNHLRVSAHGYMDYMAYTATAKSLIVSEKREEFDIPNPPFPRLCFPNAAEDIAKIKPLSSVKKCYIPSLNPEKAISKDILKEITKLKNK